MPISQRSMVVSRVATWPRDLLARHDRATPIETHDVERVLANINADHGDSIAFLRHGALLVFEPLASFACWRVRSTAGPSARFYTIQPCGLAPLAGT